MYKNIFTSVSDITQIKKAAEISSKILLELKRSAVEGSSPFEVNSLARSLCKQNNVVSSFFGVNGPKMPFPEYSCVMVNSETVHNIPSSKTPFQRGDVVKIDFGIIYNGFFTDHGTTVLIEPVLPVHQRLVSTANLSVKKAVEQACAGNTTGDIANVLGTITTLAGFTSVIGFCGHGIGKSIHESPSIPFSGNPKTGEKLLNGMLICIENWITTGSGRLNLQNDGWTLLTSDGSFSAMQEEMVLIENGKPVVVTM